MPKKKVSKIKSIKGTRVEVVELDVDVYKALVKMARKRKKSVEEVAIEIIKEMLEKLGE